MQDEVLNPRAKIMDQFRGPGIGRASSYSIQNELIEEAGAALIPKPHSVDELRRKLCEALDTRPAK